MFNTISPFNTIRMRFKNLSGSDIIAGTAVEIDPTPNGSATDTTYDGYDPYSSQVVLDEPVLSRIVAIQQAATGSLDGDKPIIGIAETGIKDGKWGDVVVWGPVKARVETTADTAHLVAYGASAGAAGELELTGTSPVTADRYNVAFQVGASGATSSGDLRDVFVICGFTGGWIGSALGADTPFGTLT